MLVFFTLSMLSSSTWRTVGQVNTAILAIKLWHWFWLLLFIRVWLLWIYKFVIWFQKRVKYKKWTKSKKYHSNHSRSCYNNLAFNSSIIFYCFEILYLAPYNSLAKSKNLEFSFLSLLSIIVLYPLEEALLLDSRVGI